MRFEEWTSRLDALLGTLAGDEAAALRAALATLPTPAAQAEEHLALAAHELRTPLAALHGFAEILRDQPELTAAECREVHDLLVSETARLGRLVSDMLDSARLGAGAEEWRMAPLTLAGIAERAAAACAPLFAQRGLVLLRELATLPPITGDADRLQQLATNLLANAAGFARGKVTLAVHAVPGAQCLAVSDDGPGVPPAERAAIFERFRSRRARRREGSGLGLVISRRIAEAHGGRILVRDAPGGGACFVVELPV